MSEKESSAPPAYNEGSQYPPPGSGYPPPGQGYPNQGISGQGHPQQGPGGYQPPPPGYAPAPGQPYGQPGYPQYGYATTTVMHPGVMQVQQPPPPDHFCLAVFVTLCCFWPTGILAIMKASDARSSAARGDLQTANSQARAAKQMINVSIGVGIASFIVVGIILGVYFGLLLRF